jgi:dihydroorotate dehydrogenase
MKPWLLLPPKLAHDLAPVGLHLAATFRERKTLEWSPLSWRGLNFSNPLGIAGGVDKDAANVADWWTFGPGFVEIGTVTPLAQDPNPGKIIDRDTEAKALWNRMGFPGAGAWEVRENLRDLPLDRTTPVFVNIGKNRTTPNENASGDYAECIRILDGLADAFVVNISSPNTAGLRDLFQPVRLRAFLDPILQSRDASSSAGTPILLKLSPDLSDAELATVIGTACEAGVDGFIATNTTLDRAPGLSFPSEGGVSGGPLAHRSKQVLQKVLEILGSARKGKLIVSVGGVMSPTDVFERLELGADLVQVYTALVFEGPSFFGKVAAEAIKAGLDRKS